MTSVPPCALLVGMGLVVAGGAMACAPQPAPRPAPVSAGATDELPTHGVPAAPVPTARLTPGTPRVGDTVGVALEGEDGGAGDDRMEVSSLDGRFVPLPGGQRLLAVRPGSARLRVTDARTGRSSEFGVDVAPPPIERLELDVPARMSAGDLATGAAIGFAGPGRRGSPVRAAWTSGAPEIVDVGPGGSLHARAPGSVVVSAVMGGASGTARIEVLPDVTRRVAVAPSIADVVVGDPVHLTATARDDGGAPLDGVPIRWTWAGSDPAPGSAEIRRTGTFVANEPGTYRVAAVVGRRAVVADVRAVARDRGSPLQVVGRVPASSTGGVRALLLFEGIDGRDYAYIGSSDRADVQAWDVTDAAAPRLVASLAPGGRRVTDVAIDARATLGVLASAGVGPEPGGLTLLDLLDPARPWPIATYTPRSGPGVEAVRVVGDLVYATIARSGTLEIIDVSDPTVPRHVGSWSHGSPLGRLYGIDIKDGLGYLAAGVEGLVVLDVGAGIAGGTPTEPAEVFRSTTAARGGADLTIDATAVVRYRDLVFAAHRGGLPCPDCARAPRGVVEVFDFADVRAPARVALYDVPGGAAVQLRVEDELLYVAAGRAGVRVIDVSGQLGGDLWRQGRDVGWRSTGAPDGRNPNLSLAGGVQPYEGRIYVTDIESGLWILQRETDQE